MKLYMFAGFIVLTLVMVGGVSAQEDDYFSSLNIYDGLEDMPFVVFSEGTTCSWLTRIIKQTGRSNFVFEDFLPGAYFRVDMQINKYIAPMIRTGFFYPLISTFNQFPQEPKTPLHFSLDQMFGVKFNILNFKYFRFNCGPALHLFFLNSDRWNYFELGAAAFVGLEMPLTEGWTVIFNGFASIDNGNLGGNRNMEPFDIAYQYQIDLGVRYSKKLKNKTSLFPGKPYISDHRVFRDKL